MCRCQFLIQIQSWLQKHITSCHTLFSSFALVQYGFRMPPTRLIADILTKGTLGCNLIGNICRSPMAEVGQHGQSRVRVFCRLLITIITQC
jgi:hypothetical protein